MGSRATPDDAGTADVPAANAEPVMNDRERWWDLYNNPTTDEVFSAMDFVYPADRVRPFYHHTAQFPMTHEMSDKQADALRSIASGESAEEWEQRWDAQRPQPD
jgi:hypothetical protein